MTCDAFGTCGSCTRWQEGYEGQLAAKATWVKALFRETGVPEPARFASPESHYRNRAEFKIFHTDDGTLFYAMRSREEKRFVTIEACPIVHGAIAGVMGPLLEYLRAAPLLSHRLFQADFLASREGEVVVSLLYHRKLDAIWEEEATQLAAKLGVSLIGRSRGQKRVIGSDHVVESVSVAGRVYRFRHVENSFTQPNGTVNEHMINWIVDRAKCLGGDLLELYCGAGNFTLPLASDFSKVLAIEVAKSSIQAARHNAWTNGVTNVTFGRMDSGRFSRIFFGDETTRQFEMGDFDLKNVFVDPPRAGLDEATVTLVRNFEHILYISCNPLTLYENVSALSDTHEVVDFALFDQFPYTDHIECGMVLRRRKPLS